mmetsp:Transcript_9257/g.37400  ORF Transcript_9257/g.37400 Transcript_9257/m.37400 type:complete len:211 (+) Transcript_9257:1547-2179(+)
MKRGESKTPSSYDKIAICVSFFSRRPHAAPDRLCDPTMTHARSCGAPGAYRAKVLTCGITRPRPAGSAGAGGCGSFEPSEPKAAPRHLCSRRLTCSRDILSVAPGMDPPVAYPRFDPRTSPIVGHTSFSSPSPSDGTPFSAAVEKGFPDDLPNDDSNFNFSIASSDPAAPAPKLRAISPIHFSVVAPTLVNWHTTGARLNSAGNVIPASA